VNTARREIRSRLLFVSLLALSTLGTILITYPDLRLISTMLILTVWFCIPISLVSHNRIAMHEKETKARIRAHAATIFALCFLAAAFILAWIVIDYIIGLQILITYYNSATIPVFISFFSWIIVVECLVLSVFLFVEIKILRKSQTNDSTPS
jgi:hypothetical protein